MVNNGSSWLPPGKLTWNLKITPLKRIIIFQFQTFIFSFHVSFRGCNLKYLMILMIPLKGPPPWNSRLLSKSARCSKAFAICFPVAYTTNNSNGWIPTLIGWKRWTPLKYGHFFSIYVRFLRCTPWDFWEDFG